MVLAAVLGLCSVPYMTHCECTTLLTGLRSVFMILDNKGGGADERGIVPHAWANRGEKEDNGAIPVRKKVLEHIPCQKKEFS